jgi:exosome complex component RRP42
VIDRGIRNSGAVDLGELCITPGEEAWTLFVDLLVVDFDGNLFDASHLGILKVLKESKVPASDNGAGDDFPVPVKGLPVSTTFVKLGDGIFLDPTALEERVADARISMVFDEAGDLRSVQKGGRGGFTASEIKEAFRRGRETSDRLRKAL